MSDNTLKYNYNLTILYTYFLLNYEPYKIYFRNQGYDRWFTW